MHAAAFAASFAPISPDFQLNAWNVLTLIGALVALWAAVRRKPTVDVDLVKLSGSIDKLGAAVEKLELAREIHSGHAQQIAMLERESRELRERLEREIAAQRKYSMELSREIFAQIKSETNLMTEKLDAAVMTMNTLFRDMASEIGGLKEAVKHANA